MVISLCQYYFKIYFSNQIPVVLKSPRWRLFSKFLKTEKIISMKLKTWLKFSSLAAATIILKILLIFRRIVSRLHQVSLDEIKALPFLSYFKKIFSFLVKLFSSNKKISGIEFCNDCFMKF